MKTLSFYSNSSIFGGHEMMAIEIMDALRTTYNVEVILSKTNTSFKEALITKGIPYYEHNYHSNSLQIIRNLFSWRHNAKIRNILTNNGTDVIILIQGNIDLSINAGYVARHLDIPVISYIPLAQPLKKVSKNKFIGYLKDIIRTKNYNLPDVFITISSTQRKYIQSIVPKKQIEILPNFIDQNKLPLKNKDNCRVQLNLPKGKKIIGFIGRFEAWHKGLDRYCDFLLRNAEKYPHVIFLFIGSGTYEERIESLTTSIQNIKHLNWRKDLSDVYSAIDALIMPSRFEGVSLTMLEAIHLDIPIIVNNIPEFTEFINIKNTFNLDSDDSIKKAIEKCLLNQLEPAKIQASMIPTKDIFISSTINLFNRVFSSMFSFLNQKS